MATMISSSLVQSCLSNRVFSLMLPLSSSNSSGNCFILKSNALTRLRRCTSIPLSGMSFRVQCLKDTREEKRTTGLRQKAKGSEWAILRRWDVPWKWQTVSLTSLACGLSFILTGLIESAAIPYLGIQVEELSLDQKAGILFLDQSILTAVVLGVIFTLTKSSELDSDEIFRYDFKEPFNLQKGWLLWAGIGLAGGALAIALTGFVISFFSSEAPQRDADALVRLLPLIGSSNISTACLLGITGVLAPLLEETVFRGFFMVSLTEWLPTPLAVFISAGVFAIAHLAPGEFPQLFTLGVALGFSYAQTRNLLTPITIHALWNSGVILLLTFLQLQGYDIKELLLAS